MTRFLTMLSLLAILAADVPALADPAHDRTSAFRVEGMTCALCGKAIEKTLRQIEGVRSVTVDQKAERVTVVADATVSTDRIEQSIESAGRYEAEPLAGDGGRGSETR